jgi:hypothetical protein
MSPCLRQSFGRQPVVLSLLLEGSTYPVYARALLAACGLAEQPFLVEPRDKL